MKAVKIAELKNRLSHYLRLVRRGQAILVLDRDQPVARLEPIGGSPAIAGDDEDRLAALERAGILRRGKGGLTPDLFRPVRCRGDVVAALIEDRRRR
jgi:prevent-host-death family protein